MSTPSPQDTTHALPPQYNPAQVEPAILERWLSRKAFHADAERSEASGSSSIPFSIVIPPPNVTAALHLGHALNNTLQDVLIRHHRMLGHNTCWFPGTDHAGIATQTVVEKRVLAEEGKRRTDFQRDAFVEKIQQWKDEYEKRITDQLKLMGCSCDYERQAFTMDEVRSKAVREAFFQLFKDGLIYRGKRLVNWDPVTQTALADDEVEMQEVDGNFYYMKYPIVKKTHADAEVASPEASGITWQETGEYATVATTRPETMLGDTAVAVNPKDAPRAKYIGQYVKLPIVGRVIPIIADDYVVIPLSDADAERSEASGLPADPKAKMASGFLKVTPAHDPNDYDIGQRHSLPIINVMAPDASISKDHGWPPEEWTEEFHADAERSEASGPPGSISGLHHLTPLLGLSREDARKHIVKWFKDHGLMHDVKPYRHAVGHSYRSHVPIEPYYSDQWYLKVTDDKLAGAALRAMTPSQRAPNTSCTWTQDHPFNTSSNDNTSRDRQGAGHATQPPSPQPTPPLNGKHYLITFTTYGTRLHHDSRGSIDRDHNLPGTPLLESQPAYEDADRHSMAGPAIELDQPQRRAVLDAIVEVCRHRGWLLQAANIRTNHVHIVVTADAAPEKVMNDFKAYATRQLRAKNLLQHDNVWTRPGSTRYLGDMPNVQAARRYVLHDQGADLGAVFDLQSDSIRAASVSERGMQPNEIDSGKVFGSDPSLPHEAPLPHGRGSYHAGLTFTPPRYAKTFQTWHENIRDWCISRQLWWGHRIPVWSKRVRLTEKNWCDEILSTGFDEVIEMSSSPIASAADISIAIINNTTNELHDLSADPLQPVIPETEGEYTIHVCLRHDHDGAYYEKHGYVQDPDVLDTWFSSALWPLSTMGWPDETPELQTWNPTSVLCTAREIITLWVSRMVMFNLYFRGTLPFKDVFIHAMIQDGHGQKMSKSLGNGVDPIDIIHTHGSDAMRFTLTSMTTHTQDVRMPVDLLDPHTDEAFTPEFITLKNGYKVAAPIQTRNGKKIASSYGIASGEVKATDETPVARNTSEKFDLGQRFANKVWNATRFALSNLTLLKPGAGQPRALPEDTLLLPDRWIMSRTAQALADCNRHLASYAFSDYATTLYDLFWRDLCDWYIEAIKPTVQENETQQRVLAACLDSALRLMHPAMPFVTERLFEALNGTVPGDRSFAGLSLAPGTLLCTAAWPAADQARIDALSIELFSLVQSVVGTLREVRTTCKVPPRQQVEASIRTTPEHHEVLEQNRSVIETLAAVRCVALGPDTTRPSDAALGVLKGIELYVHGALEVATERTRLSKRAEELNSLIASLEKRLSNKGYVDRAPTHLVQETRDQLSAAQAERMQVRTQLTALPD